MQGKDVTPQQKEKFLKKLLTSAGNVSKAAAAAGIARNTAYEHKKADAEFSQAWDNAVEAVADAMEEECYRRAVKGVLEPVFYKGELVQNVRKYSDRLLEFGLKGRRPDIYRERLDVNANHSGSLDVNIQAGIDSIYGDSDDDKAAGPALDGGNDKDR